MADPSALGLAVRAAPRQYGQIARMYWEKPLRLSRSWLVMTILVGLRIRNE